jgi:hypothetical protein
LIVRKPDLVLCSFLAWPGHLAPTGVAAAGQPLKARVGSHLHHSRPGCRHPEASVEVGVGLVVHYTPTHRAGRTHVSAWADFRLDAELERELLELALPIVPVTSDGSIRVTIDFGSGTQDAPVSPPPAHVSVSLSDTIGPTHQSCVRILKDSSTFSRRSLEGARPDGRDRVGLRRAVKFKPWSMDHQGEEKLRCKLAEITCDHWTSRCGTASCLPTRRRLS